MSRYHWYTPRNRVALSFPADGKTQQHFTDACDATKIVERYQRTGILDHVNTASPRYGYAPSRSYAEVAFAVAGMRSQYETLPEKVRERFPNFYEFVEAFDDPHAQSALVELGLIPPPAGVSEAGAPADRAPQGTTGGSPPPEGAKKGP